MCDIYDARSHKYLQGSAGIPYWPLAAWWPVHTKPKDALAVLGESLDLDLPSWATGVQTISPSVPSPLFSRKACVVAAVLLAVKAAWTL